MTDEGTTPSSHTPSPPARYQPPTPHATGSGQLPGPSSPAAAAVHALEEAEPEALFEPMSWQRGQLLGSGSFGQVRWLAPGLTRSGCLWGRVRGVVVGRAVGLVRRDVRR